MALIDPKGLLHGERLAACSDDAQNWWPRLFLAANGYARLELSYPRLVQVCFGSYRRKPTENQLWAVFEEYAKNFLALIYEFEGVWWVEFMTSEKFLPKYKTHGDASSPAPPMEMRRLAENGYLEWRKAKSLSSQRFQKFSETFGKFPLGIGIGEERYKESAPSKLDAKPIQAPVFQSIPLVGNASHAVTDADIAEWAKLYPAVDVPQEVRKMAGWCDANPRKRKTAAGIKSFANRWLSRVQDKGTSLATAEKKPLNTSQADEDRALKAAAMAARRAEEAEKAAKASGGVVSASPVASGMVGSPKAHEAQEEAFARDCGVSR